MPTPSNEQVVDDSRMLHASCPPDDDRSNNWRTTDSESIPSNDITPTMINEQIMAPQSDPQGPPSSAETYIDDSQQSNKQVDAVEGTSSSEIMSPASVDDKPEGSDQQVSLTDSYASGTPSMSYEFSNVRLIPSSPSSFLRAGSKFRGTQQSERQVYDVQVDIKHVDMRESFLCGYLRIQGLTEDHPTLTTYFEGEIIGSKYTFLTQHEDWGSTDKVDLQHWAKFQAFRPFAKQARKGNLLIPQLAQRENIFMRWKEHFLVPDHRVRTITGASFEGFYYICFNQMQGKVSGIYFHAKSEKFQQLELEHVPDRGCFGAMEFR